MAFPIFCFNSFHNTQIIVMRITMLLITTIMKMIITTTVIIIITTTQLRLHNKQLMHI